MLQCSLSDSFIIFFPLSKHREIKVKYSLLQPTLEVFAEIGDRSFSNAHYLSLKVLILPLEVEKIVNTWFQDERKYPSVLRVVYILVIDIIRLRVAVVPCNYVLEATAKLLNGFHL
jgi:hypothetical protein